MKIPQTGWTVPDLLLLVLVAGLGGCGGCDEDVNRLTFVLEAAPRTLDFGAAPIRFPTVEPVTVTSLGSGTVRIESLSIVGPDAGRFSVPAQADPASLLPGASTDLPVTFDAREEGTYEANLVVVSNADAGDLIVPLRAIGRAPDIALCEPLAAGQTEPTCVPDGAVFELDLGSAGRGRTVSRSVLIRNVGEAPLKIDASTALLPANVGIALGEPLAGASVVVGGGIEVPLTFLGTEQGPVSADLTIVSNDPDEGSAIVRVSATGAVNQAPTACPAVLEIEHQNGSVEVPADPFAPAARPADTLRLTAHPDASCSADPEDGVSGLTYVWTLLEAPAISGASIGNSSAGPAPGLGEPPPWLEIDAIGTYRVGLTVTDSAGLASPEGVLVIDAVPQDDLTVELSWHVGADLDLHLIAPGGVPFCDPLDCFWDTCTDVTGAGSGIPILDWGDDADADGKLDGDSNQLTDPILVFDNVGSTVVGTDTRLETIRLPTAPLAGGVPYTVAVHHFENKAAGPVDATVRVVYRGSILWEANHTFTAGSANDVWTAGVADVSTGTGSASAVPDQTHPPYLPPPPACP
ncbi:MAG: choice-of-anchor D domain-containing protein [Deltaproteobacteria bacterium]|nr:choice-of-anchor D domain-containing protein [Deltaproteobacteria bacterium]